MITKGIIKSIDLLGNTCTVHLPFFETAGNDPIIETATVSNTPGSYNGYKVGDVVYVAFEDGSMSTPVVIGKLYLGTEKEKADPRGVSNVEESTATKKATLPADAKLAAEIDSNVPNTTVPYSSLSSIANGLNTLNTNVGQMDRDYGNRFKQVISNADGLKSELEQTAKNMVAKVSGYKQEVDAAGNKIYDENGQPKWVLDDKGERIPTEFGWDLQAKSWSVFNGYKTILKADEKGLHVAGQVEAESGHIGNFMIGDSGISSSTTDGGKETAWSSNYTDTPKTDTGVYVGTDGIKLGKNFSVDTEGKLYTKSLTIAEDAEITGTIDSTNINVAGLNADGIKVVKKDENGNPVTIDGKEVIVFNADAKNAVVEIGGFTVTDNNLSAESGTSAVVLSTDAILLGGTTTSTAPFSVTNTGELTATKGKIGGFTITDTKLFAGEKSTFVSLGYGDTYYEYITFTGSQIISLHDKKDDNTDLYINYYTDTVEITAQLDISDTTTTKVIFGYLDQAGRRTAALYARLKSSKITWGYIGQDGTLKEIDTGITRADTRVHTYKIDKGALYVDGIAKGVAQTMHDNLKECPLAIGGAYVYGKYEYFLNGKIYSIKVTLPEGSKFTATGTNVSEWFPDTRGTKYGLRLINSILPDDEFDYNFEIPINNTSLSGDVERKKAIYLGSENPRTAPFSVTNTGELTATKGKIGGFTITDNNLSAGSGTSAVVLSTDAILLGGTTTSTAPFSVTNTGAIKATNGEIAGFTMKNNKLYHYDPTYKYNGSNGNTYTGAGAGIGATPDKESWAFWAGRQSGNDTNNAWGQDAPFRVGHDGAMFATRGEVGGWDITSEKLVGNAVADNKAQTTYQVNLSPSGILFEHKKNLPTSTGTDTNALSQQLSYATLAGIDIGGGRGVFGNQINRIIATSSTSTSTWAEYKALPVPACIPNSKTRTAYNTPTVLIWDHISISAGKTVSWNIAATGLQNNLQKIVAVFTQVEATARDGKPSTDNVVVYAKITNNTTVNFSINDNGIAATIFVLALCAVTALPPSQS